MSSSNSTERYWDPNSAQVRRLPRGSDKFSTETERDWVADPLRIEEVVVGQEYEALDSIALFQDTYTLEQGEIYTCTSIDSDFRLIRMKGQKVVYWNPNRFKPARTVSINKPASTVSINKPDTESTIVKGEESMLDVVKNAGQQIRETIAPYQKYIVMILVLIAIDYFIFRGGLSERIQKLFSNVADRIIAILDGAIAAIGTTSLGTTSLGTESLTEKKD